MMQRVTASPIQRMFLGELPADGPAAYPVLDAEQRELLDMFKDTLARYAALHIDSRAIDKAHAIPLEVMSGLGELGLFGMRVPEAYGGRLTRYCARRRALFIADANQRSIHAF
jgi:alkylation response protein AidB-like acyl-CoA dehydrogenase